MIFAATIAVGLLIKTAGPRAAELGVDIQLTQERNPILSFLSLAIHYGLGPAGAIALLTLTCLGLFLLRRSVVPVFACGWVVGIGWLSSELGKRLVARIRPPADAVQALIPEHGMDSFPSGHTAFAVALAWAFGRGPHTPCQDMGGDCRRHFRGGGCLLPALSGCALPQ